ncbi:MAG: polyprenyl synthetase family protein [candidate division KSB1 bacterium]|nr:polyprenyl synthetase family protein [candidate division KSB1 bacterium]MDZ7304006.1 polyprenyl synthetase family protein [candidate division KSB1 bacterium]MDZ7313284.1 polyprenyl synthetase family protein [candidate division KSB1 bacterium]
MRLKEIIEPIKEDLEAFEKEFKAILKSDIFLIDKVVHYLISHRGKRLRPVFVLLVSRLRSSSAPPLPGQNFSHVTGAKQSSSNDKRLKAAAILELLHTATLVHDDVVDDSYRRRGFPTINSIWKNKISVLMGDYLFSKSLLAMLHLGDLKTFAIISKTAERMSQGELLQVERSRDYWMEEEIYFRLISDKTAALLSAACQLGALTGGLSDDDIQTLGEFGEKVGIAFQIRDDILDLLGEESRTGKPIGSDIRENKITLPLLYALKQADRREAKAIIRLLQRRSGKRSSQSDYRDIVNFIERHGGVRYAMQTAERLTKEAVALLDPYEDSPYKMSLINLVQFITAREH